MRVGVYIDGFNLYFGGSAIFGTGAPGWKWLDMRGAFGALAHVHWPTTAVVEPVIYCTAPISARVDPTRFQGQETYLRALTRAASVDRIEYGKFFEKVKTRPVALADRKGRPIVVAARHPVVVKDAGGSDVPDAVFMVTVADREEKG